MQSPLKTEEVSLEQRDFVASQRATNGDGFRLYPPDFTLNDEGRERSVISGSVPPEAIELQRSSTPVRGALVVSTSEGETRAEMLVQFAPLEGGGMASRFFDEDGVLEFDFLVVPGDQGTINLDTHYSGKPLNVALERALFFDSLTRTPGTLYVQVYEPQFHGFPIAELPLPIPEAVVDRHRDRLRVLEALHEVWRETGVEIRYPSETDDDVGLSNLNHVLKAVRSGWVPEWVSNFHTPMPRSEAQAFLEELKQNGEVLRAFGFDVPNESYRVFDKQIDLGPSRRYLASARLVTLREELEGWLSREPATDGPLDLTWEPTDDLPVHVFYLEWPRTSTESVRRALKDFEDAYGYSSDRFGQAWEAGEAWAREIEDGKEWFSLIQALNELTQED